MQYYLNSLEMVPTYGVGGGQHEALAAHLALEGGDVGPELGGVLAPGAGAGEVPGVPAPITAQHHHDPPIRAHLRMVRRPGSPHHTCR